MRLIVKKSEVSAGRPIIFLHPDDATNSKIHVGDRVEASFKGKKIIGRVDFMNHFLKTGEIFLSDDILEYLNVKFENKVDINLVPMPKSASFITKKMNGKHLQRDQIYTIIKDVVDNALTEAEIAQFIIAVYKNGMSQKETVYLTESICKTGTILKWPSKKIADKHCIGGIAGNRTTPIVVSICAAAGIIMPKTSSRAITSAAGTADVVETLTKVDFPSAELVNVVKKTGACLAWGGSLGLAPADDKLIKIERILNLDPESQLLASILSKKIAVGSTHVLIDIPFGEGAKVSKVDAEKLKNKFISLAKSFKLKVKVALTDGSQPIGNGVGPVLEMIDVIKVLKQDNPPKDLETKAIYLSGIILEMLNKAKKGKGQNLAREILRSGKAYKKFNEIIDVQGRKNILLKPAKYTYELKATHSGKLIYINNKLINYLANVLGCPVDKSSGIYLHKHNKDTVSKGEVIATFYSESKDKLNEAVSLLDAMPPILTA